ncbi:pilus assembly protein TadG-related protein [Agromyces binzhouensis]|uniref:pilus assembly protein TadG-related protein n=1 Tax=Agromyces binzhouensis TaxID=1817495 RepID=UPI0013ED2D9C|nr:pilus assembly protein TadG-related protein [Agromyces binzhouensis]
MNRRVPVALRGDESGSTLLLTILFGALALALVLVVTSATSLYLERKRLFTLADGAALAAAESWRLDEVRVEGDALVFGLDEASVAAAAADYLGDAEHSLRALEVVRADSGDGRSASVTLRAMWHAPISTDLMPVTVPIEVTADARSVFH